MNIMLDLETLSSRPDACILAIGAAVFSDDGTNIDDPGADLHRLNFYQVIESSSAQQSGGRIDASTVQWWAGQSAEARMAVFGEDVTRAPLKQALQAFAAFCLYSGPAVVWGNGASFDCVILRQAYERLGLSTPWAYRDERCYRTLKNLRPDIPFEAFGVKHHALDDAITQARHAERIFAAMRKGNPL